MSVGRVFGAVAIVIALVLLRSQRDEGTALPPCEPSATAIATAPTAGGVAATTPAHAAVPGAAPELPGAPPFRDPEFAVTTDMPEGALVVLRSSVRTDRDLQIELATREPLADGRKLYANVSVSDALGNTVLDCTWRDVAFAGDDVRKLDCELPAGVALPLTISGHQLSAPSFIENPTIVAIDRRAH